MNLYVVTVDYTAESDVREHRVSAGNFAEAVLQAGAFAGRETEGNVDTLKLLAVDKIIERRERTWSA